MINCIRLLFKWRRTFAIRRAFAGYFRLLGGVLAQLAQLQGPIARPCAIALLRPMLVATRGETFHA
jgi:hypothetical protein